MVGTTSSVPATATANGMVWGAYPAKRGGEDEQAAVQRLEQDSGRKLAVVRDYLLWNSPFPDTFHTWLRDTGHVPIISVRAAKSGGMLVPWASIAAAQPGSALYDEMVSWADRFRDFGAPIYFSFNHEPETAANQALGSPGDFIAAWRRMHDLFVSEGATNVKFMWIMTDYAFFAPKSDRRYAPNWYPGDAWVDAIGADAYNWFNCRAQYNSPWKTLEQIIAPLRDFGLLHPDEEMWVPEWASVEDPSVPGRKAQWIADAQALFKRPDYSQFVGMSYFDSNKRTGCAWPPDTSGSSLAAFRTMGADPFYGGSGVPLPTPPSFVASANTHGQRTTQSLQIPTSVRTGDTMLLFYAANSTSGTVTAPAGWTELQSADPSGLRSRVYARTAIPTDPGSSVTVSSSVSNKGDLTLAAYRSFSAVPVDASAVAVETTPGTQHVAPSITTTQDADWVIAYWVDRSNSNTAFTVPTGLTRRRAATGSSTGHLTSMVADTAAGVAAGPTQAYTAVGTASATSAVMYTIALRPGP